MISDGRMKLNAESNSFCSGMLSLETDSCSTGTLLALYSMISGGCVPGGAWRMNVCPMAVTWALELTTLALGWK